MTDDDPLNSANVQRYMMAERVLVEMGLGRLRISAGRVGGQWRYVCRPRENTGTLAPEAEIPADCASAGCHGQEPTQRYSVVGSLLVGVGQQSPSASRFDGVALYWSGQSQR